MAIRLNQKAVMNVKGNTKVLVNIAEEFGLNNISTVRRWLRDNKVNGPLTTKAALKIISLSTGVPEGLLTEDPKNETNPKGVCSTDTAGTRPFS